MLIDCLYALFNHVSGYTRSLAGGVPVVGQWLLRDCLMQVHKDIVTCWNFRETEGKVTSHSLSLSVTATRLSSSLSLGS